MWLLNENKSPYLVAAIFGGGRAQPILSWQHLVTSAQVPTHFLHFIFALLLQREPDFNACALRTLLSIGLALDFHRAPRQNVSVQSFLTNPPLPSLSRELWSASREEIFEMYWISICREQNVLMRSLLRSTNKQGRYLLWKNNLSEKRCWWWSKIRRSSS